MKNLVKLLALFVPFTLIPAWKSMSVIWTTKFLFVMGFFDDPVAAYQFDAAVGITLTVFLMPVVAWTFFVVYAFASIILDETDTKTD